MVVTMSVPVRVQACSCKPTLREVVPVSTGRRKGLFQSRASAGCSRPSTSWTTGEGFVNDLEVRRACVVWGDSETYCGQALVLPFGCGGSPPVAQPSSDLVTAFLFRSERLTSDHYGRQGTRPSTCHHGGRRSWDYGGCAWADLPVRSKTTEKQQNNGMST